MKNRENDIIGENKIGARHREVTLIVGDIDYQTTVSKDSHAAVLEEEQSMNGNRVNIHTKPTSARPQKFVPMRYSSRH